MMHRQWWSATDALNNKHVGITQVEKDNLPRKIKHRPNQTDFFWSFLLFICLTLLLRTYLATGWTYWRIDHINLGIHEIGHLVFGFFGWTFLHVVWWTAGQLIMPTLFLWYVIHKKQYIFIPLILARYATNFFYIATYMYDATRGALPMVSFSGDVDTTIHDRQYIFSQMHILHLTDKISYITRQIGSVFLFVWRGRSWFVTYTFFQRWIHHEK